MGHPPRRTLRAWLQEPEAALLGASLLAVACALVFGWLADELGEGDLGHLDERLLELARTHVVRSGDSMVAEVALNITALGGVPVLVLLLLCVLGYLLLRRQLFRALYVLCATAGGAVLSQLLKASFTRMRPGAVHRLVDAAGWSFPSGHALGSVTVYLTLGALIAATLETRIAKLYVLTVALSVSGLVGVTRVLLGVHYVSDVLAGWTAGLAWALSCWVGFELWERRRAARRADAAPPNG